MRAEKMALTRIYKRVSYIPLNSDKCSVGTCLRAFAVCNAYNAFIIQGISGWVVVVRMVL
jgi:hypothetical protein